MARIRTYQLDENLSTSDYLLGNDGDNGSVITKRFNLEDLRNFILGDADIAFNASDLPQGYIPTNNQAGDAFERSPLQVQHTNELGPHVLLADGTTATFDMFFLTLSNGQQVLRFENYNEPFYLQDFVGREFRFKVEGSDIDDPFQTGTFQEYRGFIKEDTGTGLTFNDYVDVFYVTTSVDPTPTIQIQDFIVDQALTRVTVEYEGDQRIGGSSIIIGDSNITGTLTVGGDTTLNGPNLDINSTLVEIGEDDARAEVHLQGTLHFDDPNEGIVFGPTEEGMPADMTTTTFTVDAAGNLTIDGAPTDDLPTFTFTDTVNVSVDSTLTTTGINNTGPLNQDGDTSLTGDLTIYTYGPPDANGDRFNDDGEIDNSHVTISDGTITSQNADGSAGASVVQIYANNQTDVTEDVTAQLATLTIGSGTFTLPEFSSGVAEALPGLTEDLEGAPAAFSTGRFFIGNEQSTGALYQGSPTEDITGITQTIAAGVTSHDLDTQTFTATAGQTSFALNRIPSSFVSVTVDGTDVTSSFTVANPSVYNNTPPLTAGQVVVFNYDTADVTAFETLRGLVDADNREAIFFVQSDFDDSVFTTAVPGTTVIPSTDDVYEIISYDNATKVITFGKLGTGTINIDTEALSITSNIVRMPGIDQETFNAETPDFHQFVTIDAANELSKSPLSFSGDFRGARYTDDDETDQGITSISFIGNNSNGDAGAVTVDTDPRYGTPVVISATLSAPVDPFDVVILRPCAAASSFTLPLAVIGDSVKIVNTSLLDTADPFTPATTDVWSIFPNTTQAIMGISSATVLPMGETPQLELDTATASFELLYSGDDLGWVIIGAE